MGCTGICGLCAAASAYIENCWTSSTTRSRFHDHATNSHIGMVAASSMPYGDAIQSLDCHGSPHSPMAKRKMKARPAVLCTTNLTPGTPSSDWKRAKAGRKRAITLR